MLRSLCALAFCTAAAVLINWRLLGPDVISDDALVHQYWMWQFRDPQLFTDALTAAVRESARYPDGYEALFWVATRVADPIAFGEWLGVALMALSAWLVFLIVREHTSSPIAPWLGAALFLALFDIHRFYGGFPRAFVHPVVLLTVLLAIRGRQPAAALVAVGGALLYPPAALLAVGVLLVSAVRWPLDRRRAAYGLLALVLAAAVVLAGGGSARVFTAAEARALPEFGTHGALHFFTPSTLDYLRQNRSGFDLRASGSTLALAALALLLVRRSNLALVRREVIALPVVALGAWALAQLVLFRLYLPHRYTYPLAAFFAIVVAVTLPPTWSAVRDRRRPRAHAFGLLVAPLAVAALALCVFPLGPAEPLRRLEPWAAVAAGGIALAAAIARWSGPRVRAAGALVTGLALVAALLLVPGQRTRGSVCAHGPLTTFLDTLPKDAVIAGDPADVKCLPVTARRAVVISTQLAPSYEVAYFREARARMLASLRASYGPSEWAIADLGRRYGATHFLVRRDTVRATRRWRPGQLPYGRYVTRLLSAGTPAAQRLPASCRRWRGAGEEVYEIHCLAATLAARPQPVAEGRASGRGR